MNDRQIINYIEKYIFQLFNNDVTGHDYYHMKRVAKLSEKIALAEEGNPFIAVVAGWIHDVGDKKLFKNPIEEINNINSFMTEIGIKKTDIDEIMLAIKDVSFSKGHQQPSTLEGQIVQDADRLDAIGAIGIARTFAYGGSKGQLLFSENEQNDTSVQHFHDKLLLLKDLMNTNTAKSIAEERHKFMEAFLKHFQSEWNTN